MGLPFMPARGILGSDYMRIREDFKVIDNPYNGEEKLAAVPAIVPDVAAFHAYQADRQGNVMADASQSSKLLAQAASRAVIATVEELVDNLTWRRNWSFIPANFITAVAHAPCGAHPTSCSGYYDIDSAHMQEYVAAAKDPEKWKGYLDKYIYSLEGHQQYLENLGPGGR